VNQFDPRDGKGTSDKKRGENNMDARKDYVAPAIAAEDDLEQTSLACTGTAEPQPPNYNAVTCQVDVSKGGAWPNIEVGCTWETEDVIILS
jgi:hypothetical protein